MEISIKMILWRYLRIIHNLRKRKGAIKEKSLGIILCITMAGVATILSGLHIGSFSMEIIGAPVLSILMGMLITMFRPSLAESDMMRDGIKFAS